MMKRFAYSLRLAPLTIVLSVSALLASTRASEAQITLTGATLFNSAANGTVTGGTWNTNAGDPTYNLYLFTGTAASPTFLNSGDTAASLTPNVLLTTGTYTINFAASTDPAQYYGINLYFDSVNTINRISAVVQESASGGGFAVIGSGINTFGLPRNQVPSADSLTYSSGGLTVTLSNLVIQSTSNSGHDIVSAFNATPDGFNDNIGTMTLTVTGSASAPEPAGVVLAAVGVLPLAGCLRRKRTTQ